MNHNAPFAAGPRTRTPRAFTLIEIIVAIAILVVIISLLIVGLNRARRAAHGAAGAMNVASLRTATEQFVRHFGFAPPMIKDWGRYREVYTTVAGEKRLSVYQPSGLTPAGIADRDFLRRDPIEKPIGNLWGDVSGDLKYYFDLRYSNVSLPFYLAGACEEKGAPEWQVPIDGVPGPGLLEPRRDGTFVVPDDLKKPTSKSKSTGRRFDAMVDTAKGGLQIVPSDELREFRDAQGRLYRYYLWIQGDKQGRKLTPYSLNVPHIILETMSRPEDRFKPWGTGNTADQRASIPELNAATWAILYPGPDGVFGDEPFSELGLKLGMPVATPAEQAAARQRAILDNIVEVGE